MTFCNGSVGHVDSGRRCNVCFDEILDTTAEVCQMKCVRKAGEILRISINFDDFSIKEELYLDMCVNGIGE